MLNDTVHVLIHMNVYFTYHVYVTRKVIWKRNLIGSEKGLRGGNQAAWKRGGYVFF
jgi:hypothetical protein